MAGHEPDIFKKKQIEFSGSAVAGAQELQAHGHYL